MKKPSRMQQRLSGVTKYEKTARGVSRLAPHSSASGPSTVYSKATEAQDKAFLKGKHGGNCNRTACQRPGAYFLNKGTDKHYCLECTVDIGGYALSTRQDAYDLYPTFDADMENYVKQYIPHLGDHDYGMMQVEWAKRKMTHARTLYTERNFHV